VASALVPNRPSGTSDTPAAVQRRRSRIHKHDTTSRIAPAQRQGHGSTWSAWDLPERPPRRSVHRPSSSPTRTRRRGLASSFRSTFDSLRSVLAGRRGNPGRLPALRRSSGALCVATSGRMRNRCANCSQAAQRWRAHLFELLPLNSGVGDHHDQHADACVMRTSSSPRLRPGGRNRTTPRHPMSVMPR
jgi:hypothetical protein